MEKMIKYPIKVSDRNSYCCDEDCYGFARDSEGKATCILFTIMLYLREPGSNLYDRGDECLKADKDFAELMRKVSEFDKKNKVPDVSSTSEGKKV